ncbi:MAG: hypothetical protein RBU23_11635 [Candidatus Auribacterota bacterium]|jgi:spermidine synthase|nr:hypothetical protein [Candidatus Auribacterota bacterium]
MALYFIAAFTVGFSSLIFQVVFLREFLTIFYGNELCIGAILGLWLFGIACGALLGSRIADRIGRLVKPVFLIMMMSMHVLFVPALFLLRVSIPIFMAGRGEYIPFARLIMAAFMFIVPISMLSGMLFPMACSAIYKRSQGGVTSGMIYFAEAAGSLTAGCLFTFFFVTVFNHFQMAFIQISMACTVCLLFVSRVSKPRTVAGFLIFIIAAVVFFLGSYPSVLDRLSISARWDAFFSPFSLDRSVDTKYQNISLSSHGNQLDIYSNLKYLRSIPDPYTNETFAQYAMCQSPNPESVLIIQGVFSGLIDPCRSHNPSSIDVLELDDRYYKAIEQAVPDAVRSEVDYPEVRIYFADGRFFIKQTGRRYDVVIIDLPDPDTAMLNRFYTLDFFKELKTVLKPSGIIAFHLTSAPNYLGETVGRYNSSIYKTVSKVFGQVIVTHGEIMYFVASANSGSITSDPVELIRRYDQRSIERDTFIPQVFYDLMNASRLEFVRANLEQLAQSTRANTDANPVAYYYNLYLWDEFSGSGLSGALKFIERFSVTRFAGILLILTLGILIPSLTAKTARRKTACLRAVLFWVICSTGFTAMGIELLLLFAFQNIFGYLYSMIGFIVALFMFGLTVGVISGMYGIRKLRTMQNVFNMLLIIEIVIPLFAFALPETIKVASTFSSAWHIRLLFFSLVATGGILTGVEFPLAVHLFSIDQPRGGFSSGILDAADHFGAFAGALLVGTFILPLFGSAHTAILIGLCNLSSCVVVAASRLNIMTRRQDFF